MIYLMMDKHPVHISGSVQDLLYEHRHRIKPFFLLGYCPEVNPREKMNNDTKANVSVGNRPRNASEFINMVCDILKRIGDDYKGIFCK